MGAEKGLWESASWAKGFLSPSTPPGVRISGAWIQVVLGSDFLCQERKGCICMRVKVYVTSSGVSSSAAALMRGCHCPTNKQNITSPDSVRPDKLRMDREQGLRGVRPIPTPAVWASEWAWGRGPEISKAKVLVLGQVRSTLRKVSTIQKNSPSSHP